MSEKSDKERGLYPKYTVKRNDDPEGKHSRCFNFVLDLDHDPYAFPALAIYIQHCQKEYPLLAAELALQIVVRTRYDSYPGEGLINVRIK